MLYAYEPFDLMVMQTVELMDENDKLKAENAKLRAERDYLLMNANPTAAELRRVRRAWKKDRDENAKLREIATEAIRLMQADGPDCGLCNHFDECWAGEAMNYSPSGCVICNDARELGVEAE